MRADRLLSILLLLQSRGRLTAAVLAERLEVSERTIYRDLDALSAAGVPVYADRGPGGGCALRSGYKTDLTGLNSGEIASLFAGTVGRQLRDLGLGAGFQSALAKLEANLPSERRADAERARDRVHVDPTPWFAPHQSARHLPVLRDAVFRERRVRLAYRRGDGREVSRRVEPLGLVVKGGIWYLVALTAAEMRVYRISRLRAATTTAETFERPAAFDLAAFWGRWSSDLIAGIPEYRVRLRVKTADAPLLPQILGERIRAAIDAADRPQRGVLLVDYSFDSAEAARGAILGLGRLVEVVEPGELRASVRELAEAVARQYRDAR